MKKCPDCNITKSINDFSYKNKVKGTRQHRCKTCQKMYYDAYYKTEYPNRSDAKIKYVLSVKKDRRKRIANVILDIKQKIGCQECGENDPACLDFHHPNNDKEYEIGNNFNKSLENLKKEMLKCIVLCANCHRKFHFYEKQAVAQRESIPFGAEGSLVQS